MRLQSQGVTLKSSFQIRKTAISRGVPKQILLLKQSLKSLHFNQIYHPLQNIQDHCQLEHPNQTWSAAFMSLTIISNCWCSSMVWFPTTWIPNSSHKASLAAFDLRARITAGNVFLASEILFSKIFAMQLRKTSSLLALLVTRGFMDGADNASPENK